MVKGWVIKTVTHATFDHVNLASRVECTFTLHSTQTPARPRTRTMATPVTTLNFILVSCSVSLLLISHLKGRVELWSLIEVL